MNPYREYGQEFRLWQAAIQLGNFTVSELESLTGVNPNTIYSALASLEKQFLQSEDLPSQGRGRPRKRYWLTEAGMQMLAAENANILANMGKIRGRTVPTLEELLGEIAKLPVDQQLFLVQQIQKNTQNASTATAAAQFEAASL